MIVLFKSHIFNYMCIFTIFVVRRSVAKLCRDQIVLATLMYSKSD